jgi:hypothetical protein
MASVGCAAGLAAIAIGALIMATIEMKESDYQPTLFDWLREKDEKAERDRKEKLARQSIEESREYYRQHPEEAPPRMPNPNYPDRKYIV